ncbi:MAG: hypothetical protein RL387_326 [Bacteroidota bacterium]|jgi:hypothetical protein
MKKYIFIALAFVSMNAFSQEHFNLGIKVGQNFSKVDNVAADRSQASFHIGAQSSIRLTNILSVAPEVILSQTKLEADPSLMDVLGGNNLQPETYHLNYLSFPVLLQVKPINKLVLELGPQYSVLMNQSKDGKELANMAFKSGEFAFVGGAKIQFSNIAAYGRYVVGMQDVNELQDQQHWKTRQWQLGISLNLFGF